MASIGFALDRHDGTLWSTLKRLQRRGETAVRTAVHERRVALQTANSYAPLPRGLYRGGDA